ncbi:response regulator [Desulfobacter curvatus]|uniref:response regulator n=1 Tax=Desulfobacter curvatus TaxID=2290 RepID=UPI000381B053|nr:response regulator [Desulfobacter curvatus]
MDALKNFASKNFTEQVKLLKDIEKKKIYAAIPKLVELCKKSDPFDQATAMAENTLRSLLLGNEEQTVKGLMSDNANIKKISLQVCCRKKCSSATSTLIKLFSDLISEQSSELIPGHPHYNEGFEILSALSLIQPPEALDIFRQYLHHSDALIASLSIEAIGNYKDIDSVDALCKIVEESEADDRYEECDIVVAGAIDALAMINTDRAISFLASKIHHRNPVARRIIHAVFPRLGPETIHYIAPFLLDADTDLKIMAVNILGAIGDKKGADLIVDAVDKGVADHPNVKFAVYEALGQIFSMKSLILLTDGLLEQDPSILIAVITSLNNQINPGVAKKLKGIIEKEDDHSSRLINAVVASRALALFESLYEDEKIGNKMIEAILKSNDKGLCSAFSNKLKSMENKRAESDAIKIESISSGKLKKRILIVDDSKSMLAFYRTVASAMQIAVTAAENGQQALDILESDNSFDLILTDLNMPVMTGIELTQKVRANHSVDSIPIVIATTESEQSQEQLAKKMGANDFIKKPFTADQLQDKINTFF